MLDMQKVLSFDGGKTFTGPNVTLAVGATHAETGPIYTTQVRLSSTQDCYIAVGPFPVADSTGLVFHAGVIEIFDWVPGWQLSAIQVTSNGVMSITPMGPGAFPYWAAQAGDSTKVVDGVVPWPWAPSVSDSSAVTATPTPLTILFAGPVSDSTTVTGTVPAVPLVPLPAVLAELTAVQDSNSQSTVGVPQF